MEFEGRFIDIMEVFNVDKYEFNIKLEQIKKLAAKKEYKQAAEIAKQMNWNKVKDWSTLATIINVQEAAGDYEEARDMAILAGCIRTSWRRQGRCDTKTFAQSSYL